LAATVFLTAGFGALADLLDLLAAFAGVLVVAGLAFVAGLDVFAGLAFVALAVLARGGVAAFALFFFVVVVSVFFAISPSRSPGDGQMRN
jgi:hypothetical protein